MPTLDAAEELFVDANIDGDIEKLEAVGRDLGDGKVVALVNALFICSMWERFPNDPSAQEIADFSEEALRAMAGAHLQPIVLEAVVRLAFGEETAADSVDQQLAYQARIALITYVFHREPLSDAARERFKSQIASALRAAP